MNAKPEEKGKSIKCPKCGREVKIDAPYLPFCSKRCKMVDLGVWLEEGFRIDGEHGNNFEAGE